MAPKTFKMPVWHLKEGEPVKRVDPGIEMKITAPKILAIIGLCFALVATYLLFEGSKSLPHELQSFNGNTELEKDFKKARNRFTQWGFGTLGLGFLLQLIATIKQE